MLEVHDIRHSFQQHAVLKGVTFSVPSGSITGVIGPSGVGKSVLLKIIGGVLVADHGMVCLPGGVSHGDCGLASDDVSLMFQEGALFDSLTVYDNVAFPLVRGRVPAMTLGHSELDSVHNKVEEILGRVGLCGASLKFPAQLSGGMRRRVSLARALVSRPKILLLDDPTSGLDPVASGVIMELIRELHSEYRPTTIMVSQDLRRLLPAVQQVIALFDGQVQFAGTLRELTEVAGESVRHFVSCRFDLGHVQ